MMVKIVVLYAGAVAGAAGVEGDLRRAVQLTATASGLTAAEGALEAERILAGISGGNGAAAAAASISRLLSAAVAGIGDAEAGVTADSLIVVGARVDFDPVLSCHPNLEAALAARIDVQ